MMRLVGTLVAGLLFAVGLAVGGMTQPAKVVGFLDVTGSWDASLMFVMMGAIAVYAPVFALVKRQSLRTLVALSIPTRRDLDTPLIAGSAVFGVGWGLGGFCPGPGIVAASSAATPAIVFTVAMLFGMGLHRVYRMMQESSKSDAAPPAIGKPAS